MKLGSPKILPPCANVRGGDYSWEPDAAELAVIRRELKLRNRLKKRFAVLAALERRQVALESRITAFQKRQLERISAEIEQERAWLERENEWEERLSSIQAYVRSEREKEERIADKKRLERLKQLTAEINRDMVRVEREELIRRGVYRGRRGTMTYMFGNAVASTV